MHHDEANQAVKFGALLERGEYRYDTHDHHGPTLYYLTLPAAWLRGQTTLASLDERTLRGVPAVFGAATILLLPLLSAGIGRTAVASGAVLMALSPAMVFYSRMYIQESLFACFTLAFAIAIGRVDDGAAACGGRCWRAWRQAWRSRPRRPRSSCCPPRGGLRGRVVVAGADRPRPTRWPTGDGGRRPLVSAGGGGGGRSALLLVVSHQPRRRPRAAPGGRHLSRSRRGSRRTTCSRGTTTWDCSPSRRRAA